MSNLILIHLVRSLLVPMDWVLLVHSVLEVPSNRIVQEDLEDYEDLADHEDLEDHEVRVEQ